MKILSVQYGTVFRAVLCMIEETIFVKKFFLNRSIDVYISRLITKLLLQKYVSLLHVKNIRVFLEWKCHFGRLLVNFNLLNCYGNCNKQTQSVNEVHYDQLKEGIELSQWPGCYLMAPLKVLSFLYKYQCFEGTSLSRNECEKYTMKKTFRSERTVRKHSMIKPVLLKTYYFWKDLSKYYTSRARFRNFLKIVENFCTTFTISQFCLTSFHRDADKRGPLQFC